LQHNHNFSQHSTVSQIFPGRRRTKSPKTKKTLSNVLSAWYLWWCYGGSNPGPHDCQIYKRRSKFR